jgi:hypothetical protein
LTAGVVGHAKPGCGVCVVARRARVLDLVEIADLDIALLWVQPVGLAVG